MATEIADAGETVDEFDLPPGVRTTRLETIGDVQRELARLYRAAKAKRISMVECNGLTQTLFTLSKMMAESTVDEVVKRLADIEARIH